MQGRRKGAEDPTRPFKRAHHLINKVMRTCGAGVWGMGEEGDARAQCVKGSQYFRPPPPKRYTPLFFDENQQEANIFFEQEEECL